jgi:hypothetical protein
MLIGGGLRFAIDTHDLLTPGMGHSGKNACLSNGGVIFVFENSRHRNLLVTEGTQQKPAGIVIANDSDGQDVDSKVCQVIRGIGAATRNDRAIAVAENQHRRFAGYA